MNPDPEMTIAGMAAALVARGGGLQRFAVGTADAVDTTSCAARRLTVRNPLHGNAIPMSEIAKSHVAAIPLRTIIEITNTASVFDGNLVSSLQRARRKAGVVKLIGPSTRG